MLQLRTSVFAYKPTLDAMPKSAFKVRSWQNDCAPATRAAVYKWLDVNGLIGESWPFKRNHYVLIVYPKGPEGQAHRSRLINDLVAYQS